MRRGRILGVALGCLGCLMAAAASAEEVLPRSYADGAAHKLGRGAANVLSGPLEMIRIPRLTSQQEGGFSGLTVGMAQGARAMVLREVVGAYEILTFLIPAPDSFRPIVLPEFIFAHGEWVPLPDGDAQ